MGGLRKKIPCHLLDHVHRHARDRRHSGLCGIFQQGRDPRGREDWPHANLILWLLGVVGAGLTSFYMFRLVFLTFFGAPRYDEHKVHVHESPKNMTVPLMVLAFLSIFGGWFAAPKLDRRNRLLRQIPRACFLGLRAGRRTPSTAASTEAVEPCDGLAARAARLAGDRGNSRAARRVVVLHQAARTSRRAWRRAFAASIRCC